jgi:hypothetical protein
LRHELLRKAPRDVVLGDHGHEVVVHPGAHGVPHRTLFLGQQPVDPVEVDALELGSHKNLESM